MQQPACANCSRRGETCEYPPQVDEGSVTPPPARGCPDSASTNAWTQVSPFEDFGANEYVADIASSPPFLPDFVSSPSGSETTSCARIRELLEDLLKGSGSWFSAPEVDLWIEAIAESVPRYRYLQHCIQAVAHIKHHNDMGWRWPSTSAYQHQLLASEIFREETPTVNDENWLPILAFAIMMLVFQFGSQNHCDDTHFNTIETLQVLRNTMQIEEAARPYFRRTEFWKLIEARTTAPNWSDLKLRYVYKHTLQVAVGSRCVE